jgi:phosphoglycolate phosphatase
MSKYWIFDFDGTLINSEKHVRDTFLKITKEIAPERLFFAEKVLIGPPLEETAKEILGNSQAKSLKVFTNNFIKIHDNEILKNTIPYTNSERALRKLFSMGHKIAVATNKRYEPTMQIINHFGWDKFFFSIECSDSEIKRRTKSKMIKDLLMKDINFQNAFFVGDTLSDGISANKNNLRFIKANYGYGNNEDWSNIEIFAEINDIHELGELNTK